MICPYCGIAFIEKYDEYIEIDECVILNGVKKQALELSYEVCLNCKHIILSIGVEEDGSVNFKVVYPTYTTRKPIPAEVTDVHIREDYKEACLVLSLSPKASAALSRRCLQSILKQKGKTTKFNLADAIDEVKESLPSTISDSLHVLREMGNFATHEQRDKSTGEIIDVNNGEAEYMLDTLELLFDYYYVQPIKVKNMKDSWNKKLAKAGRKKIE